MLVRIVGALTLFLGTLVAGLWTLHEVQKPTPPRLEEPSKQARPNDEPLFYRTIGQVPQLPSHGESEKALGRGLENTYTLELAVFEKQAEAERLLSKLAQKGVQAYYTPLQNNGRVVYRVRQGAFASQSLASVASKTLWEAKALRAKIVKLQ